MKSKIVGCTIIAGLLIHLLSTFALSATERRVALVIGNGAYKSAPLRNPVNDAIDIADALEKLGFSVIQRINADQRTMEESIRDFGKKLRLGGTGLFYFAGHGIQIKGRNYLIPIGAAIESEADVKYESVDAGRVLAQMEEAENSLNIIIFDACRDNPFARSFRSSERGLAKMDAPTGTILAYATAPGSVASDGPGRNGLYTSSLLKHMMTPGVEIEKVFKKVRIDVVSRSGKNQVPWESSSLIGDFYFVSKRGIVVTKRHPKESQSTSKEGDQIQLSKLHEVPKQPPRVFNLGLVHYSKAPKTFTVELPKNYANVEIGVGGKGDKTPNRYGGWKAWLKVNGKMIWKFKRWNKKEGGIIVDYTLGGKEVSEASGKDVYLSATRFFRPGANKITYYHYNEGPGLYVRVKVNF